MTVKRPSGLTHVHPHVKATMTSSYHLEPSPLASNGRAVTILLQLTIHRGESLRLSFFLSIAKVVFLPQSRNVKGLKKRP